VVDSLNLRLQIFGPPEGDHPESGSVVR
jgi:hypothetical protein